MTLLLETKEKMKQIYASYSTVLLPVLKFILAMVVFKGINSGLNFVKELDNIFVLLILALICSILPLNVTVLFGVLLLIGQCYGVGIEVAGFAAALILILLILYIRFTPKDALVLLLTPLAFKLGIPCAIPIGYGLTQTSASAVSTGCGVIVYYFMELVSRNAPVLQGAETKEMMKNLKFLLDGLLKNPAMLMSIIAFAAVLVIVNAIRRLSVDYAWQIAIFTGSVLYPVIMIGGGLFVDVKTPVVPLIAGTVGALIVSLILEFFLFHVDYTRTEHLQFEDDQYCYYVKAIPKMSIANKDVTVKTIQETIPFTGFNQNMSEIPEDTGAPVQKPETFSVEDVDFESKLEQSLKDL